MEHDFFVDCHVHTRFSFDSEAELGDITACASEAGLRGFTVTDHCEICVGGVNEFWSFDSMKASFDAAREAAEKSGGKQGIYAGVELGQPNHHPATAEKVLAQCDYDCVLASIHYLRDGGDFYYLDYINEFDPYEVYGGYLDEMLEVVKMDCFDSLAHITYPLRYIINRDHIDFDEARFYGKYDDILSLLAKNGRALEINTSGGRKNHFILPDNYILTRFRELGGRYITLGSDAHRAFGVGGSFDEGKALAKAAGFDAVTHYVKHKPVETKI